MKQFFPILQKCTLFTRLSDAEIEEAADLMSAALRHYEKGEFLHTADEPLTQFALVAKGLVGVFIDDLDGERTLMAQVHQGNTFGESICFLGAENPNIYAIAEENCIIIWLSPKNLFSAQQTPLSLRLAHNFTAMMAQRTLSMNDRIQILSKRNLRDKITTYFTFLAKQTGKQQFTLPFDREDMAAYLGVNRSALSRELSKMKRDNILDYHKNTFRLK